MYVKKIIKMYADIWIRICKFFHNRSYFPLYRRLYVWCWPGIIIISLCCPFLSEITKAYNIQAFLSPGARGSLSNPYPAGCLLVAGVLCYQGQAFSSPGARGSLSYSCSAVQVHQAAFIALHFFLSACLLLSTFRKIEVVVPSLELEVEFCSPDQHHKTTMLSFSQLLCLRVKEVNFYFCIQH